MADDMHNYYGLLGIAILFLGLFTASDLTAQWSVVDTFYVTIGEKTPEHPYYNQGYNQGYLIDGSQSPTLSLVRDSVYAFNTSAFPVGPVFDFYTIPIGGNTDVYQDHVLELLVSEGIWIVKCTRETPDTLYYASHDQPWMGGTILVVDSLTTSVHEESTRVAEVASFGSSVVPNPVRRDGEVRFRLDAPALVRLELIDPLGRVVAGYRAERFGAGVGSLRFGTAGLAAGLYLYRLSAIAGEDRRISTGTVHIR